MESARAATRADAPRLVALCRAALGEIEGQRGGTQLASDILGGLGPGELVDVALADPDAHVVAGEYDGALLGLGIAVATGTPRTARVRVLYVEPGVRAVGVGEAVLLSLVSWATARGCDGIEAVALPGSRHSKSFFETNGMVARALVMHRSLP